MGETWQLIPWQGMRWARGSSRGDSHESCDPAGTENPAGDWLQTRTRRKQAEAAKEGSKGSKEGELRTSQVKRKGESTENMGIWEGQCHSEEKEGVGMQKGRGSHTGLFCGLPSGREQRATCGEHHPPSPGQASWLVTLISFSCLCLPAPLGKESTAGPETPPCKAPKHTKCYYPYACLILNQAFQSWLYASRGAGQNTSALPGYNVGGCKTVGQE